MRRLIIRGRRVGLRLIHSLEEGVEERGGEEKKRSFRGADPEFPDLVRTRFFVSIPMAFRSTFPFASPTNIRSEFLAPSSFLLCFIFFY